MAKKGSINPGKDFAVLVESLYVANLLILPVIAFIFLFYLYLKKRASLPALAASHLEQTINASIWIGVLFFGVAILTVLMKALGIEDLTLWIIIVITFTIIHATMVLFGVIGLAKALSGKCWRYPLVGKPLPESCPGSDA